MSDLNKLKELAMPFNVSGWFVNQDEEVVAIAPEAGRDDSGEIFVACSNALETARFIAAANPATVISMIEQLEDGKSFIARQSEIIANQNQRLAELEAKIARRDASAGDPVGLQCMGDNGKWQDCASREVAESYGFTVFRQLYTTPPAASLLPALNSQLIDILGRPNFTCSYAANILRKSGMEIKRKSENEQATVIYFLLNHYFKHGDKWFEAADKELAEMAAAPAPGGE